MRKSPYILTAFAVGGIVLLLSAFAVWEVRQADHASSGRASLNNARVLAEDIQDQFDRLDALLKSVARLYAGGGEGSPEEKARLIAYMAQEIADNALVARLLISDARGDAVLAVGDYPIAAASANVSKRASFQRARAGERGLMFDGPLKSIFADEWVLVLARAVVSPSGEFLGTVSAAVPLQSLRRLLSTLKYGAHGVAAVWTADGEAMVERFDADAPTLAQDHSKGLSQTARALLRDHPDQTSGVYQAVTPYDGVERLLAFQKLRASPFVTIVGEPVGELDRSARLLGASLGLLSLAVTAAAVWLASRLENSAALLAGEKDLLESRVAERTRELDAERGRLAASADMLANVNRRLEAKNHELIVSERKFSDTVAAAPNPIFLFQPDGHVLEANAAACRLLGYERDELIGRPITSMLAPEDQPSARENMRGFAAGEFTTVRVVRTCLHKDGRRIPVQMDTSVAKGAAGEVVHVIALGQDISERLAYEARLKAMNDTAIYGVCIVRLDGTIVEFSRSFAEMNGYSADEMKTLTLGDLEVVKSLPDLLAVLQRQAESGSVHFIETKRRRKDGSIYDVEIGTQRIELDGQTFLYNSTRDVSERVRLQQALEAERSRLIASERKFSDAMASAPNGMAILAPDGRIVEANAVASEILGFSRDELRAKAACDLAVPEEKAAAQQNIRRILAGERRSPVLRRWLRKDGRQVTVQLELNAARAASGEVEHLVMQFQDVSERLAYEARLRALLDTSADGVCILDLNGAIVDFSPSVVAALGYQPDELKTMNVADINADMSVEALWASFRELVESGQAAVVETRQRRKDGSILEAEISAKAVELGGTAYIYTSSRDITERKRVVEALDRSRRLLQDLVVVAPYGIALFDEQRVCVVMNDAYGRIFGLPSEMLHGRPLQFDEMFRFAFARGDFGDERPIDAVLAEFERTIRSGGSVERERRLPDGRWIRVRRDSLPGGQILMTALDVTVDRTTQEDLRSAKDRLEAAAAAGVVGVWSYEAASDALVWDDVMLALHGLSRTDFNPSRAALFARVHPDDRERFVAAFTAASESRGVLDAEFRIVRPDGEVRDLRKFAKPAFGPDGRQTGLVGVSYDVTAVTEAKAEADAANRSKSDFLANMSHEIRTPLNAIVGTTELLARSALDDDQARAVRMLESSTRGMIVLVTDLLDLSKIEAGQLEIDELRFRLDELVDSVASTFSAVAARKSIDLRVEQPSDGLLPPLLGDPIRIGQVLNNYVSNALKFTLRGAVTIAVAALERGPESIRVRVAVSDTGIGIATDDVGKLFEPFVQAGRDTYRRFGGTGLGLSIAKRLIALMGGAVGVESKPGEGSTFWFEVAFRPAPSAAARGADLSGGRDGKRLDGVRILVVDDTETNREVAARLLALAGAHCETAEHGLAAVARLRAGPRDFDAVLMDVQMPEMDGLEATALLRRDPAFADLPIIALTAGAMASQRELALTAGMNGFVAKPFRLRELVAALTPFVAGDLSG